MGNSKSKSKAHERSKLELFVAMKQNSLSDLQELLASGRVSNVDACYTNRITPLFCAKSIAVATLLLENSADVNARNMSNETPLFAAAESSNTEVAKLLIEKGADVNACNNKNETLLFIAARSTGVELSKLLLENGADVHARDACEKTALHFAISGETVKLLLAHGADVNATDQLGRSPLFEAVGLRDSVVAEALASGGADVTLLSKSGESVLFAISQVTQVSTLEMLIKQGAPVNITSFAGKTPLHAAIRTTSNELARFMLDQGVPIDAKDLTCKKPQHSAVLLGNSSIFTELVTRYRIYFANASREESLQLASSPTASLWQAIIQDLMIERELPTTLLHYMKTLTTWLGRLTALCPLLHDATGVCERLVKPLERILDQIRSGQTQNTDASNFKFALVVLHIWTWMLEYKAMATAERILMSSRCLDEINVLHEMIYVFETSFEPVHDYNHFIRNWETDMEYEWTIRFRMKPEAPQEITNCLSEHLKSFATATEALRPRDLWRRMLIAGLGMELLHGRKLIFQRNLSAWETDMLPPECRNTKDLVATDATDVYMFGVCLLLALTGGTPWKNVSKDVARVLQTATRLPSRPDSVSVEQWQLVVAMCAADPAKRADVAHAVEKLRQFAREEASSSLKQGALRWDHDAYRKYYFE